MPACCDQLICNRLNLVPWPSQRLAIYPWHDPFDQRGSRAAVRSPARSHFRGGDERSGQRQDVRRRRDVLTVGGDGQRVKVFRIEVQHLNDVAADDGAACIGIDAGLRFDDQERLKFPWGDVDPIDQR